MLVWLASYPRSGNTLLRIIARQALGVGTYSVYDDRYDIGADPAFAEVVGHLEHGKSEEEFMAWARAEPGLVLAKTHEPHPGKLADPAIYVVRDGRASSLSYWRYNQQIAGGETDLMDVVQGDVFAGDWSSHVLRWLIGRKRGRTLLLRFEDLTANPEREWARVAEFLKLPQTDASLKVDFSELNARFPHFFRSGSNAKNIADFTPEALAAFDRLQGATQAALGYGAPDGQVRPIDIPSLRELGAALQRRDALVELQAASAIAEHEVEIAGRLAAMRERLTERLQAAKAALAGGGDDADRIAAEAARLALTELGPFEAEFQERLQASSARVTAASEALTATDLGQAQ